MSEKKVVAGLSLRADQFKQELEEIRDLEKKAADGGEAFATSFSDGFTKIEERAHKMAGAIASGGTVSQKTFNDTIGVLARLQAAAEAGGKSIEEAPEPIRKAFQVAEQQLVAVSAQMQQSAANTEALRERLIGAGAAAAGLGTSAAGAAPSLAALSAEEIRVAEHAEEVSRRFADIPEQIDEIRKSTDKTFDEQKKALESVAKELKAQEGHYKKLGSEGSAALQKIRTESSRVEAALEGLSREAQTGSARIKDGFLLADRQFEKLTETVRAGSPEMTEQLRRVIGVQINLRNEIERMRAAGEEVAPAVIAQYKLIEQRVEATKVEVRTLTSEISRHSDSLAEAGTRVTGLQGLLEQALGRNAALVGKAGIALGLIKESYDLFRGVADAMGVDQQETNRLVGEFSQTLKEVNNDFVNMTAASMNFVASLATGDLDGARVAMRDYVNEVIRLGTALDPFGSDAAEHGLNALLAAQIPLLTLAKTSTEELAEVSRLRTEYEAAGLEGLKIFNETLRKHPEDVGGAIEALKAWSVNLKAVKTTIADVTKAEGDRQKIVGDAIKQIDDLIIAVRKEREERKLGKDAVDAETAAWRNYKTAVESARESAHLATKVEHGLSESMHETLKLIKELLPNWENNTAQLEIMADALAKDTEAYKDGLNPAQEENLRLIAKNIKALSDGDVVNRGAAKAAIDKALSDHKAAHASETAAGATEKLTVKLVDGKKVVSNAAAAAEDAAVAYDKTSNSIRNTTDALDTLGEKRGTVSEIGQAARDQVGNIIAYNNALDGMAISIEKALINGRALVETIAAIGRAAANASGGKPDGSTEIPDSGAPGYPGVTEGH